MDDAVRCTIRVAGALEPRWSHRMGGLRVAADAAGGDATTELSGELTDQAALLGVLNSLYGLGLPLLSVACVTVHRGMNAAGRSDEEGRGSPAGRRRRGTGARPREADGND